MKRSYHTLAKQGKVNERQLAAYLTKNGQASCGASRRAARPHPLLKTPSIVSSTD